MARLPDRFRTPHGPGSGVVVLPTSKGPTNTAGNGSMVLAAAPGETNRVARLPSASSVLTVRPLASRAGAETAAPQMQARVFY